MPLLTPLICRAAAPLLGRLFCRSLRLERAHNLGRLFAPILSSGRRQVLRGLGKARAQEGHQRNPLRGLDLQSGIGKGWGTGKLRERGGGPGRSLGSF